MAIDVVIYIQSMKHLGGTEIVALNLKNALNEIGLRTVILSVENYQGKDKDVMSVATQDIVTYGLYPLKSLEKLVGSQRYSRAMSTYLKDFCRNHQVKAFLNFTYENLPSIPNIPSIVTFGVYHWSVKGYERSLHDIAAKKTLFPRLLSRWILRKNEKRLHQWIAKTDYAIALTCKGKEELVRLTEGKANTKVIPNFLPHHVTPGIETTRNNQNLKAVFVGRLSKEKGVFHLLDIWSKITRELPEATLDIYGSGSEKDQMQAIINEKGIMGIKFRGFESDPSKIYGEADMLLCTSETEGFGMVLIEAMQHGVIPLAFDCPVSPKELISDAGITFECFNTSEYANQIVALWKDKERMQKLRVAGLNRSKEFEKERVVTLWKQLIESKSISL